MDMFEITETWADHPFEVPEYIEVRRGHGLLTLWWGEKMRGVDMQYPRKGQLANFQRTAIAPALAALHNSTAVQK